VPRAKSSVAPQPTVGFWYLFRALAWADVLLTLDRGDFEGFMDKPFYGLLVFKPGAFLERERAAGRLK
jgi:hypothetical protein